MRENIQGRFRQVPHADQSHELVLVPVWYTEVPARELPVLLQRIKKEFPTEPYDLSHIRRIVKLDHPGDTRLRVMVCSQRALDLPSVRALLPGYVIAEAQVARYQADTKEEAAQWSESTWPIMWRGNVAAVLPTLDQADRDNMDRWSVLVEDMLRGRHHSSGANVARDSPCGTATATVIVDPKTGEIAASAFGDDKDPLGHSIMLAAGHVAARERDRQRARHTPAEDRGYLCLDMDVYTTHEPCAMCAMALVHSRVRRLIFNRSHEQGAISTRNELSYGLHGRRQLNHTYEAWERAELPEPSDPAG